MTETVNMKTYAFHDIDVFDLYVINAGTMDQFWLALGGTLCIAAAPVACAFGQVPAAITLLGSGIYCLASI